MPPYPHAWRLLPYRESALSLRLARWRSESFFFLLESLLASLQFSKTCGQPLEFLTKPKKSLVFGCILLRLLQLGHGANSLTDCLRPFPSRQNIIGALEH